MTNAKKPGGQKSMDTYFFVSTDEDRLVRRNTPGIYIGVTLYVQSIVQNQEKDNIYIPPKLTTS